MVGEAWNKCRKEIAEWDKESLPSGQRLVLRLTSFRWRTSQRVQVALYRGCAGGRNGSTGSTAGHPAQRSPRLEDKWCVNTTGARLPVPPGISSCEDRRGEYRPCWCKYTAMLLEEHYACIKQLWRNHGPQARVLRKGHRVAVMRRFPLRVVLEGIGYLERVRYSYAGGSIGRSSSRCEDTPFVAEVLHRQLEFKPVSERLNH